MASRSIERAIIEEELKDLDKFHKLLQDRDWRYRWLIRGKLILDINEAMGGKPQCVHEMTPHSFTNDVPLREVVFMEDLQEVLARGYSYSLERVQLPTSSDKCRWCGGGWTAETFLERHVTQLGLFYHPRCWEIYERSEEREHFAKLLGEAGIARAPMVEIANGYWGANSTRPWFRVSLPGGDLTIGWRKRVISIGCPAFVGVDKMFPDENVTKECNLIHAWGEGKAVTYLRAIASKMKHPKEGE